MSKLQVDSIDEVTSANGVTVDGLNIKDSKLTTANSVVTTNITDANVTTAKITDANVTTAKIADANVTTAKITDANVTTAKIADVNVTEGKIADNAITLAKMASGTDGNIISYDASGNPVAVATGNDGQVLTSTGAGSPPAFETLPAGGSWVLVNTQTVSGTPTTIEPGAVFSATYDTYVVVIRRYNNASGGGFQLQLGTSGGYTTSGYRWNVDGGGGTGSALNSGVAGSSIIDLLGGTSSTYHVNSSQDCLSGVIWIHNPFNSGRTSIHAELSWENATDLDAHIANVGGHPNTNTQYDRWKLICPSSSQTFEATTIIQTFGVVNA